MDNTARAVRARPVAAPGAMTATNSSGGDLETLIHLAGAVALLLWGIRTVRTGVERMFGPQIETHIAVLTGRRPAAFAISL